MLKNKVIGIFLVFFAIQLSAMAISSYYKNFLNTIEIKKDTFNKYSVNLKFNHSYTEPLVIQQKGKNLYSIVLPETKKSTKAFNIIKEKNTDKIQLKVAEYPYLDQTIDNGYVKIILRTQGNVSLTATTPKKVSEENQSVATKKIQKHTEKPAPVAKTITKVKQTIKKPEIKTPIENTAPVAKPTALPITNITQEPNTDQTQNTDNSNLFDFIIGLSLCLLVILVSAKKIKNIINKKRFKVELPTVIKTKSETGFKSEFERLKEKENELTMASSVRNEVDNKIKLINEAKIVEKEEPKNPQPDLLSNIPIDENKGFYLVNVESQVALIGYINDEIFIINRFDNLKCTNLQTRLNERQNDKSTYIVRLDDYRALVEVTEDDMNLVIEL